MSLRDKETRGKQKLLSLRSSNFLLPARGIAGRERGLGEGDDLSRGETRRDLGKFMKPDKLKKVQINSDKLRGTHKNSDKFR